MSISVPPPERYLYFAHCEQYYFTRVRVFYTKEGLRLSLYVIADLHLSLSEKTNKSMEVFGAAWTDYTEKLRKNWSAVVCEEDTVIVPGDISWAMKLEEAYDDLKFLDSLPGTKIIGKGNHDFWWSTASKIENFFAESEISTIKLLHNNAYKLDDCIVCGTRGWFYDEKQQNTINETDCGKIVAREAIRLETSLRTAEMMNTEGEKLPVLVFLHFPPVWNGIECRPIIDVLHRFGIKHCYFGHIHGNYTVPKTMEFEGISFVLVSADYLKFAPMPIFPDEF